MSRHVETYNPPWGSGYFFFRMFHWTFPTPGKIVCGGNSLGKHPEGRNVQIHYFPRYSFRQIPFRGKIPPNNLHPPPRHVPQTFASHPQKILPSHFSQCKCKLFCCHLSNIKVFQGVRTPGGLFLGVWYAGGIDFRRFRTPSLPIFGIILGLLEMTKMYQLFYT